MDAYKQIKEHTRQFALVVDCFAASLAPPFMYDSNISHFGFRYGKPTAKHFCILKAVRVVSGLNACIALAEKGFNQEICVLLRTIIECTTYIEYISAGLENGVLGEKQQKLIELYFSDFHRNSADDFKGPMVRQEDVHKEIGKYLEGGGATGDGGRFPNVSAKKLMSNVYQNFSNYMHARYPEVMDMYGGAPAHFHMEGMRNTPKDDESLAMIACFTDSVSLALTHMVIKFDMKEEMQKIPDLAKWFPKT